MKTQAGKGKSDFYLSLLSEMDIDYMVQKSEHHATPEIFAVVDPLPASTSATGNLTNQQSTTQEQN